PPDTLLIKPLILLLKYISEVESMNRALIAFNKADVACPLVPEFSLDPHTPAKFCIILSEAMNFLIQRPSASKIYTAPLVSSNTPLGQLKVAAVALAPVPELLVTPVPAMV